MTITNLTAAVEGLREIVGRMTPGEVYHNHISRCVAVRLEDGFVAIANTPCPRSPHEGARHQTWARDAAGIVALRNTAMPIIDAQAARIAELEAEVARLSAIVQGWHYLAVGPDEMGDYYTHKQLVKLSEPYGHPSLAVLNGGNHE